MIISNIWENNIDVPNHQPGKYWGQTCPDFPWGDSTSNASQVPVVHGWAAHDSSQNFLGSNCGFEVFSNFPSPTAWLRFALVYAKKPKDWDPKLQQINKNTSSWWFQPA